MESYSDFLHRIDSFEKRELSLGDDWFTVSASVARKVDDMTPIYLEGTEFSREEYSMVLAHLDRKGLIDIDYRNPLSGFDYASYAGYPVHGSMALTERGHTVIELMEMQGIEQ